MSDLRDDLRDEWEKENSVSIKKKLKYGEDGGKILAQYAKWLETKLKTERAKVLEIIEGIDFVHEFVCTPPEKFKQELIEALNKEWEK